jgi:hypothetical protein
MANPLETFICQFVQALEQQQTPQGQSISQLFHQIATPVVTAITEFFRTIEQHNPTSAPTGPNVCDFVQPTFDNPLSHNNQIISDFLNDLHKATTSDFHLI